MTMVGRFTDSVKNYPIVWYYVISVLIVILIIPVFLLTGADVTVERSLEKSGIQFNKAIASYSN